MVSRALIIALEPERELLRGGWLGKHVPVLRGFFANSAFEVHEATPNSSEEDGLVGSRGVRFVVLKRTTDLFGRCVM